MILNVRRYVGWLVPILLISSLPASAQDKAVAAARRVLSIVEVGCLESLLDETRARQLIMNKLGPLQREHLEGEKLTLYFRFEGRQSEVTLTDRAKAPLHCKVSEHLPDLAALLTELRQRFTTEQLLAPGEMPGPSKIGYTYRMLLEHNTNRFSIELNGMHDLNRRTGMVIIDVRPVPVTN
jgi:hypothetical protein